jgi:hypothetical protein
MQYACQNRCPGAFRKVLKSLVEEKLPPTGVEECRKQNRPMSKPAKKTYVETGEE